MVDKLRFPIVNKNPHPEYHKQHVNCCGTCKFFTSDYDGPGYCTRWVIEYVEWRIARFRYKMVHEMAICGKYRPEKKEREEE